MTLVLDKKHNLMLCYSHIIWTLNGKCSLAILCVYVCSVAQSCLTLCDLMNYSPPGCIFQARILKWVAIAYSRGFSQPKDQTCISCIVRQILYHSAHLESPCNSIFFIRNLLLVFVSIFFSISTFLFRVSTCT